MISVSRKEVLKILVRSRIVGKRIKESEIFEIANNDEELDFLYNYLLKIGVVLPGMDYNGRCYKLDPENTSSLFEKLNLYKNSTDEKGRKIYLETKKRLVEGYMIYAKWVIKTLGISFKDKAIFSDDDIEQIADSALMSAVDKFKVDMGYSFTTYAFVRIKYALLSNLQKDRANSSLDGIFESCEPSIDTLSDGDRVEICDGELILDGSPIDPSKYPCEMRDPYYDMRKVDARVLRGNLRKAVDGLGIRNGKRSVISEVIKMRYGLDGYSEMTLGQVGEALGITSERVRACEAKGIKILRSFRLAKTFKGYEYSSDLEEEII